MKHTTILLFIAMFTQLGVAQTVTLERQVIGSTGNYAETNDGSMKIASTVGEAVVTTERTTDESIILTQGFQQPVTIIGELDIKLYNGFTPNGDGFNDSWIIDGIEQYPENHVQIFNRWGDLIWAGRNYDNVNVVWSPGGSPANGADSGNGQSVPAGTYFYIISIPAAQQQQYKGWVQVIKN